MANLFPHKIERLDEKDQREIRKHFKGYNNGLVKVLPKEYIMLDQYSQYAQKYYDFKFKPDDVLIMTYPKCGTTWTQEIVWTMRNGLDVNTKRDLNNRSPFLEFDSLERQDLERIQGLFEGVETPKNGIQNSKGLYLELADSTPSPRTIKTHLPFSLLHPLILDTVKVIYVARNPKDACVSFYHHHRLIKHHDFAGGFAEFVDFWCRDLLIFSPFMSHLAEGWSKRVHPNVHFLFYEDMKEDIMRELRSLNTFLGTSLDEKDLQLVANHTKFSNMKSRPTTNPTKIAVDIGRFQANEGEFIRKGITGDWVNYFTPELEEKFQDWLSSSTEEVKNIPFRYQI